MTGITKLTPLAKALLLKESALRTSPHIKSLKVNMMVEGIGYEVHQCECCREIFAVEDLTGKRIEATVPELDAPPGIGQTLSTWVLVCTNCEEPPRSDAFKRQVQEQLLRFHRSNPRPA